ncbi:hypothetical protein CEXT_548381 [Caerostris extrusa]|uniref:Uncharacterized protein n=1 Tax=Caerostris extrusa TaxID=172846 RepID=A0AAV4WJM6_CAEEX|nr:hypothetical protein CEXT_548381 [Caerostris extrusa]
MSGKCALLQTVLSFGTTPTLPLFALSKGFDGIPAQLGNLPGYAIFLISAAAILLLGYVVIGCVCCPNHNIKALSYQNGFSVSRLNENNSLQFENPSEFAIFPPHSAVIDLQPVGLPYPTFEDKGDLRATS